jgi:hypothetical protein
VQMIPNARCASTRERRDGQRTHPLMKDSTISRLSSLDLRTRGGRFSCARAQHRGTATSRPRILHPPPPTPQALPLSEADGAPPQRPRTDGCAVTQETLPAAACILPLPFQPGPRKRGAASEPQHPTDPVCRDSEGDAAEMEGFAGGFEGDWDGGDGGWFWGRRGGDGA